MSNLLALRVGKIAIITIIIHIGGIIRLHRGSRLKYYGLWSSVCNTCLCISWRIIHSIIRCTTTSTCTISSCLCIGVISCHLILWYIHLRLNWLNLSRLGGSLIVHIRCVIIILRHSINCRGLNWHSSQISILIRVRVSISHSRYWLLTIWGIVYGREEHSTGCGSTTSSSGNRSVIPRTRCIYHDWRCINSLNIRTCLL